jgi:pimeloyl-ACP methyl ester carboxylesterase
MSTGKNFQAFLARGQVPRAKEGKEAVPLWQRLAQAPVPLLLIYGKQDRGAAAERAALAKQHYPSLNLHLIDRCKHLIQWDAAAEFAALSVRFLAD